MELFLTMSLILGIAVTAVAVGVGLAHRQFNRKRMDDRMSQALRRGIANPQGAQDRPIEVLQWQTCEPTSARWS